MIAYPLLSALLRPCLGPHCFFFFSFLFLFSFLFFFISFLLFPSFFDPFEWRWQPPSQPSMIIWWNSSWLETAVWPTCSTLFFKISSQSHLLFFLLVCCFGSRRLSRCWEKLPLTSVLWRFLHPKFHCHDWVHFSSPSLTLFSRGWTSVCFP